MPGPSGPAALCNPLRLLSGRPHDEHFHVFPLEPRRMSLVSSVSGCSSSGRDILSSFVTTLSEIRLERRAKPLGVSSRAGAGVAVPTRARLIREAGDDGGGASKRSSRSVLDISVMLARAATAAARRELGGGRLGIAGRTTNGSRGPLTRASGLPRSSTSPPILIRTVRIGSRSGKTTPRRPRVARFFLVVILSRSVSSLSISASVTSTKKGVYCAIVFSSRLTTSVKAGRNSCLISMSVTALPSNP